MNKSNLMPIFEFLQRGNITSKEIEAFLKVLIEATASAKGELKEISEENIKQIKNYIDYIAEQHDELLTQIGDKHTINEDSFKKNMKSIEDMIKEFKKIKPKDGKDGKAGKDGHDGRDGRDGNDGQDAPEDNGNQIVDKINALGENDEKIDASHIKNLPEFIRTTKIAGSRLIEGLQDINLTNVLKDSFGRWALGQITVSATAPSNPVLYQLWYDIS